MSNRGSKRAKGFGGMKLAFIEMETRAGAGLGGGADSRSLVLDMQSLRCLSDIQEEVVNGKLDLLSLRTWSKMEN